MTAKKASTIVASIVFAGLAFGASADTAKAEHYGCYSPYGYAAPVYVAPPAYYAPPVYYYPAPTYYVPRHSYRSYGGYGYYPRHYHRHRSFSFGFGYSH